MITRCMWYACLFPLEGRYIEFIKLLQVSWKQLYRQQMLLVRNKLSLTHCICLVIIFAFPLISHACSILSHTCKGLMIYFHCSQLVCPFLIFSPFPCFTVYSTYSFMVHNFLTKSRLPGQQREATQQTPFLRTTIICQHQFVFFPGDVCWTKE